MHKPLKHRNQDRARRIPLKYYREILNDKNDKYLLLLSLLFFLGTLTIVGSIGSVEPDKDTRFQDFPSGDRSTSELPHFWAYLLLLGIKSQHRRYKSALLCNNSLSHPTPL